MGVDLYWQPAVSDWNRVDRKVYKALEEQYGDIAGSVLDEEHLPFLKGLALGGAVGAKKLIKAIEKHGRIRVDT